VDILLTGATGFIGTYLSRELSKKHRVYAITRKSIPKNEDSLVWIEADLSKSEINLTLPEKIDAIIYLAQSRAYRKFPDKAFDIFQVNVGGAMAVLDFAMRNRISRFIYTSSANVYSHSKERLAESAVAEPASFYGKTKLMAEMMIESYAQYFGCCVLRLFTAYGRGQSGMLIPSLVSSISQNQPINIQGKHGLRLSPMYITDIVRVIQSVLEDGRLSTGFDVFNVGGDEVWSIYDIANVIGRELNILPRFEFIGGEEPGGFVADNSKLRRTFDLGKFISLDEGIKRIIE
jgi:UDP-glucose 4-epimerase